MQAMDTRERGRGVYRILWILAFIAIMAQLAMARQPVHRALTAISEWDAYEWEAMGLCIECPKAWKRQQGASRGGYSQEMLISHSGNNRVSLRRSPLRGSEYIMALRDDSREATLNGMHRQHLGILTKRMRGISSGTPQIGQVAGCFAIWSDVSYRQRGILGGEGTRIVGRCYTIVATNDEYWLDCFGEEASWKTALEPAYRRMIESLHVIER